MVIEAKAGETINVLVEGKQTLPKGAYLYMPQPADKNGDGISTSREASQILVGVAEGLTAIQATDSVTLDIPETDPVTADLKLQKTDEKGVALTGAAFDLYFHGEEAIYNVGTYAVDENGVLVVEDLLPGNYELVESVVPDGYLDPEKSIAFSIDEEGVLTLADAADAELVDGVVVVKNYPPSIYFEKGTASNISFLYVNKETGKVTFDYKFDFDSDDCSAKIEYRKGYISVVFIKQSTTGMIWTSEEVDDATMSAIVASIKKNNKSYKGHNAVAVGEGVHELTYNVGNGKKAKTKTVYYTFTELFSLK